MMPMKFTARKSSHDAVSWSNIRPALFTRQSTRPSSSTTCFPTAAICSASLTSASITSARPALRLDVVLDRSRLVDALQVDDGDVGSLTRERSRVGRTDALRGTGDDADLPLESFPHGSPSPRDRPPGTALRTP